MKHMIHNIFTGKISRSLFFFCSVSAWRVRGASCIFFLSDLQICDLYFCVFVFGFVFSAWRVRNASYTCNISRSANFFFLPQCLESSKRIIYFKDVKIRDLKEGAGASGGDGGGTGGGEAVPSFLSPSGNSAEPLSSDHELVRARITLRCVSLICP